MLFNFLLSNQVLFFFNVTLLTSVQCVVGWYVGSWYVIGWYVGSWYVVGWYVGSWYVADWCVGSPVVVALK
jgi:hypothetical protein